MQRTVQCALCSAMACVRLRKVSPLISRAPVKADHIARLCTRTLFIMQICVCPIAARYVGYMAQLMRLQSLCIRKYRAGGPALIKRYAGGDVGFISVLGATLHLITFTVFCSKFRKFLLSWCTLYTSYIGSTWEIVQTMCSHSVELVVISIYVLRYEQVQKRKIFYVAKSPKCYTYQIM